MSTRSWPTTDTLQLPPTFTVEGKEFELGNIHMPANRRVFVIPYYAKEMEPDGCLFSTAIYLSPEQYKSVVDAVEWVFVKLNTNLNKLSDLIRLHRKSTAYYHELYPTPWSD